MGEEVVEGGSERWVTLADPDAKVKQSRAVGEDEFGELVVNSMEMT